MAQLTTCMILLAFLLVSQSLAGKQPSCRVCKKFVESFEKRLDDTSNSNFAGGDTHWEEEKLGLYANSEVRLIEMLDNVCKHSDYDCHRLLENHEEEVERWWFKQRHKEGNEDLKQWLCFFTLSVCCPPGTFGPTCSDCPGGSESPCGGHGACEGSEEKDGKGECSCESGYTGVTCQSCDSKFYNDTENGECKRCDPACKDSCTDGGPDSCKECAEGYEEVEETCKDIDECRADESLCKDGTYCLNTPGKYRCRDCDKACTVCNGPGPSKCGDCSKGFVRNEGGVCEDVDECETEELCSSGMYCVNTDGSYACKVCHMACQLTCSGPGPEECDECKSGYRMEEDVCVDIDECTNTPGPCDPDKEVCVNLAGTFSCKCNEGLIKSEAGKCEKPPKKVKKKKKKTKKGKKAAVTEGEGDLKPDQGTESGRVEPISLEQLEVVELDSEAKPASPEKPEVLNGVKQVEPDVSEKAKQVEPVVEDMDPNQTEQLVQEADVEGQRHGNEEAPDIIASQRDEL